MKSWSTHREANRKTLTIISLLFAFSAISYFDRTIISIAGPSMMRDFHLSPTEMGAVYSAFIFGYALLMIPGGHFTDGLGPRRTLAVMGWSSAVFTALTILGGAHAISAYVGIVPLLFAVRFGMGAGTAPLYPACAKATANWIPRVYHARVQGLIIAGSAVGAAISPFVFTWLMEMFRWRISFVIAALVTVLLTIAWQWQARDYPPDVQHEPKKRVERPDSVWVSLFTNRSLMLLTFAYGALGYFQYIFFYWMYYYFGEVLHLGSRTSAVYTTILFLTEGALMPMGGFVSDRLTIRYGPQFGRRIVPISGLTLAAILLYIGTISSGLFTVTCFSLAFGFAACCEGPFWATVTEMAGERLGRASSILNTGAQIGGVFAPIATPWIAARVGWASGLHAGGLAALSAAVAIYCVKLQPLRENEPILEPISPA